MKTRIITATNPNRESIWNLAREALRYFESQEGKEFDRGMLDKSLHGFLMETTGHHFVGVAILANPDALTGGITIGAASENGSVHARTLAGHDLPSRRDDAALVSLHASMVFAIERFDER